jgi:ribonuclease I
MKKHSLLVAAALLLCLVALSAATTAKKRVPWADEYISAEEKERYVSWSLAVSWLPSYCVLVAYAFAWQ